MKRFLFALSVSALLAGCAASGPISIGQDRYMLTDQDTWGWSGGAVVQKLVQRGAEVCAKQGKQFELLNSKSEDAQGLPVARYASGTIEFTCK